MAYDEGLATRVRDALAGRDDLTGRVSKNMVYLGVDGLAEDGELAAWLKPAVAFAGSLPPK